MSASRMREHLATYEHKARCLREEADAADAKRAELRASIEACEAAERAALLAEEQVRPLAVPRESGGTSYAETICGPWADAGRGSRRRLIGVGREGKLLACYSLHVTGGGERRLTWLYGTTPTAVDLAMTRAFT